MTSLPLPQYVQSVIDLDKEYIAKLEGARAEVPEELSLPKPRSRKSLGGAAGASSNLRLQVVSADTASHWQPCPMRRRLRKPSSTSRTERGP